MEKMETKVVTENPAFYLNYSDYNVGGDTKVSWDQLKNDPIGTLYETDISSNCGRNVYNQSAKIVFKDEKGCLILERTWGTTDDSNPEDWEQTPKLIWYEFNK